MREENEERESPLDMVYRWCASLLAAIGMLSVAGAVGFVLGYASGAK